VDCRAMERPSSSQAASTRGVCLPPSLEQVKVQNLPSSAFYIPNFIGEDEERVILDRIANAPKPRWKQLTHRRLQTWPSDLVKNALIDAPLPQWLEEPVVSRLLSIPLSAGEGDGNIFTASPHRRPNHVLINEYPPGVGIMPHKVCYNSGRYMWES
jgi:alkylated DNA repair protein alkB family protein 6